jgi:hypothetical protein
VKRALYARIAELLAEDPGVRPENVLINLVEVKRENRSFGNGLASYALQGFAHDAGAGPIASAAAAPRSPTSRAAVLPAGPAPTTIASYRLRFPGCRADRLASFSHRTSPPRRSDPTATRRLTAARAPSRPVPRSHGCASAPEGAH